MSANKTFWWRTDALASLKKYQLQNNQIYCKHFKNKDIYDERVREGWGGSIGLVTPVGRPGVGDLPGVRRIYRAGGIVYKLVRGLEECDGDERSAVEISLTGYR